MSIISIQTAPSAASRTRAAVLAGVHDITPMVIGVMPFGLAIGAAIASSEVSAAVGVASATLILAGAAQLTTVQMLDAGSAPIVIILSALMINARLVLYSASLAPWFREQSLRRRLVLAGSVIDQLHFTCVPRFERGDLGPAERVGYYVGASLFLVGSWTAVQTTAIVVGTRLPDGLGLHVAAPLALVGLLAKSTTGASATIAAVVGAAVAVIGIGLPFRSAVLVATLAGIATAVAVDAARARTAEVTP